jgi:hydroxyethylthiazole kinase-like uncharacterized protein yjeF
MRILTAEQMHSVDRYATEELGIPSIVLMENAARGVAAAIDLRYPAAQYSNIAILCGHGNNGGDGLALARILLAQGRLVHVVLTSESANFTADAAANYAIMNKLLGEEGIISVTSEEHLDVLVDVLTWADIVVDAMLGTGARGGISGHLAEVAEKIPEGKPVIAVDLPSGISADAGMEGTAVAADLTVTIALPKRGVFATNVQNNVGELAVVGFGLPSVLLDKIAPGDDWRYFTRYEALASEVAIERRATKGRYGRMLIVGGTRGMQGAVALAARAAIRGGAGTATVATTILAESGLRPLLLEAMTLPLRGWTDDFDADCIKGIEEIMGSFDALVVGPGMGRTEGARPFLLALWDLLKQTEIPVILDADGINNSSPEDLAPLDLPMIMTPHTWELARFLGVDGEVIDADRFGAAAEAARRIGKTVVLKGRGTVVADPDGSGYICHPGSPALASGGTGDVLAGLLGALCATRMASKIQQPWSLVAARGATIHALAGYKLAQCGVTRGYLAHEVADQIPAVVAELPDLLPDPSSEVCFLPI